jgi:hypothetical protein
MKEKIMEKIYFDGKKPIYRVVGSKGENYDFTKQTMDSSLDAIVPIAKPIIFILIRHQEIEEKPIYLGVYYKEPKPQNFGDIPNCDWAIKNGATHLYYLDDFATEDIRSIMNGIESINDFNKKTYENLYTM